MPRGYRLQENSDEDENFNEDGSGFKQKKSKRILLGSICVITATFLFVAGIACGVGLGTIVMGSRGHPHSQAKTTAGAATDTVVVTPALFATTSSHTPEVTATDTIVVTPTLFVTTSSHTPEVTATDTIVVTPTLFVTTSSHTPEVTKIIPSPSSRVVQPDIANSHVLNYINTGYDPCEDFYRYSCGRWYNPRPEASQWGTINELALSNFYKIAGYLSTYPSSQEASAIRKAKYIYSACTNTDYIQNHLIARIKDFMIHKAGGWVNAGLSPASSWSINNTLYKDHYLGSTAFFQFGIEPDDLNSSLPMIRVSNKTNNIVLSPQNDAPLNCRPESNLISILRDEKYVY